MLAINQPNHPGPGGGLVVGTVSLNGNKAMAGLPFLIDGVIVLPPALGITLSKTGACNDFLLESKVVNLDPTYLLHQWYVDDVAVAGVNRLTLKPTKTGIYRLKVRETKCRDVWLPSGSIRVVLVETNPTIKAIPGSCGTFLFNAHATGGAVLWGGPGIGTNHEQLDSLTVSGISGSQTCRVRVSDIQAGGQWSRFSGSIHPKRVR